MTVPGKNLDDVGPALVKNLQKLFRLCQSVSIYGHLQCAGVVMQQQDDFEALPLCVSQTFCGPRKPLLA
jgi:hypothetical protein